MMFFKRRVVPSMPPSLVMFSSWARGKRQAFCTSIPMSDHVPELRYAQLGLPELAAGTPATAEAVSCVGGATTFIGGKPARSATSARSFPSVVPGGTILGKILFGRSNFLSKGMDQFRFTGCTHCVVLPLVYSTTLESQRAQWIKSGIMSMQSA